MLQPAFSYDGSPQKILLTFFVYLSQACIALYYQPTSVMDHVMAEMDTATRLYMLFKRRMIKTVFDNVK